MPDVRVLAQRVLCRVETEQAWASPLLEAATARLAEPRDAALLRELVLGVLRWRRPLDHALARFSKRPLRRLDAEVLAALRVGAYSLLCLDRVPGFAAVDRAVESVKQAGKRSAAGYVNAVLRGLERCGREAWPAEPREGDVPALALFASHPEWWVRRRVERHGWDATAELLAASNRPVATVLRPHPERIDAPGLRRALEESGYPAARGMYVADAVRVTSGATAGMAPLREGRAWVQDEASQLVPLLFGPARGRALDVCAAPGGKTMMLAAGGGEPVIACDLRPSRLRTLAGNLERTGLADRVHPVAADMTAGYPFSRRFDRILLDAPCTGTGTLARRPEIRWRLRPEGIERLAALQSRLLRRAAAALAPGGRLVYSVCSLEAEEGEERVACFLADHPGFRRVDPRDVLPAAATTLLGDDSALRTSATAGTDGFFAAVLERGL